MKEWIERIGRYVITQSTAIWQTLRFAFYLVMLMGDSKSYNSAMKLVLVRQIYFTAVQVLPLFLGLSILLGAVVSATLLSALNSFNLLSMLGDVIIGVVVNELSPFVTVLLIALRSSSAINAEIAVMKVDGELETLRAFAIDEARYLYLPRLLGAMVSTFLLSALFSFVFIGCTLLFGFLALEQGIDAQMAILIKAVDFSDIAILSIKSLTFGLFAAMIPIMSGMAAPREMTAIPIAVLEGMVKVFIAIILIEVISLALRLI
ncbi:MAG: ABC transporter permease [Campylobacterales bacterium]